MRPRGSDHVGHHVVLLRPPAAGGLSYGPVSVGLREDRGPFVNTMGAKGSSFVLLRSILLYNMFLLLRATFFQH